MAPVALVLNDDMHDVDDVNSDCHFYNVAQRRRRCREEKATSHNLAKSFGSYRGS